MNSSLSPITPELAIRLEACYDAFSIERLEVLRSLPGNPYRVQRRFFGDAIAFLAQDSSNNTLFNRVTNINAIHPDMLDSIIAWYHSHGVHCSFDIIPSHDKVLFQRLASKGFYQSDFYTMLYGLPTTRSLPYSPIEIRPVLWEEKDILADIYIEGFAVESVEERAYLRDSFRFLVGKPSTHCLFALIDKEIAATAILFLYQNTGYLALAVTRPAFRGYGCQTALVQARLAIAADARCELVAGQADFTSISLQNMQKVGLRVAYTKALWVENDF